MLASWGRIVDSAPFSVLIEAPNLDVNVQTPAYGWTALMMAVRRSVPSIVARLLERGADVHAVMKGTGKQFKPRTEPGSLAVAIRAAAKCQGFTALDWAEKSKRAKAVALLREAGAGGGATAPAPPG